VFAERARGNPLSPRDAEAKYGIRPGRGRHYVETDVPASRVKEVWNPDTKSYELQIEGDVAISNPSFFRR
jgi:Glu-tRNA(Gln) amidotransferase subunit E-like FAD-binding protein